MANFFDQYDVPALSDAPARITITPRDRDLITRTIIGEADAEPDDGKRAVAEVIRNRTVSGKWGPTPAHVVLAPNQFEPWQRPDGRQRMYAVGPDDPKYQATASIVDQVFADEGPGLTQGATHFFSPNAQRALGRQPPKWAKGQPINIGTHAFFAPEGPVMAYAPQAQPQPAQVQPTAQPTQNFFDQFDAQAPAPAQAQQPALATAVNATATPPTTTPTTTTGEALQHGIARSATFNFLDEINGIVRAGGGDPNSPDVAQAVKGLVVGAYKKIVGDKDAEALYEKEVAAQRERTKTLEKDSPTASVVGNIAGAVALPGGAMLQAATLPARMLRGATLGSVFGTLFGLGEGTDTADRVTKGVTGAVTGATVGALAPPITGALTRGVQSATREAGRYLFPSVEQRAARVIQESAESAQRLDPQAARRLTPAQVAATQEARVIDMLGERGRGVARWAANASPEARETLNTMINPRFEGQADRIVGFLNRTFHYPNATAQERAIQATARAANAPAYAQAFRDGRVGVWSQELADLSQAPPMQDAIRGAIRQAQTRSAPDVQQGAAQISARWLSPQGTPTLEFWDLIKRQLDQQINVARRGGMNEEVAELTRIKNMLVSPQGTGILDRAVPSYTTARATAAHFFGAENALEAGQNFVTQNFANREVRAQLARMNPTERQLFQDGFVSRYIDNLEKTGTRRNVLNTIANSPQALEKLEIVLGRQGAANLEAMLRVEGIMQLVTPAVQGQSTTARQLVELGLASTYSGVSAYNLDPTNMATGLLLGAFAARGRNTDQRVARRVAEMLVSRNPQVFQNGLNAVARNNNLLNGLRDLDRTIARVIPQQTTAPALQGPAISRADQENQEPVPRPPGQ